MLRFLSIKDFKLKKKLNLSGASEELMQGLTGAFYIGTIYPDKKIADAIEKKKRQS